MATFEERFQIRNDTLAGKIPKRIFVSPMFTFEAACGYAGVDLLKAHFDMELREKAYEAICKDFYSDAFPCLDLRFPGVYQLLGARNWVLASNGVVQHPEIVTMEADEYDEYIANPYDAIMEKFLPRVCTELNTDPVNRSQIMAKAYAKYKKISEQNIGLYIKMSQKYGLAPGFITGQLIQAPFDFVSDQLRSFKEIHMDLRRRPEKIKAACDATLPMMLRHGTPKVVPPGMINFIPLHLAPFINMKDFENYYWPSLRDMVVELDKLGIACMMFAEGDMTRYAAHMAELPKSTIVWVEAGDYKQYKETFGKAHVMGGFFNPTITLTKSKEECIDVVKRMLDVCAPGGHFFFTFDRGVIDVKSINVPVLQAVLEWVANNTNY